MKTLLPLQKTISIFKQNKKGVKMKENMKKTKIIK